MSLGLVGLGLVLTATFFVGSPFTEAVPASERAVADRGEPAVPAITPTPGQKADRVEPVDREKLERRRERRAAIDVPKDKTLRVTVPAMNRVEDATFPYAGGTDEDAFKHNAGVHLRGTGFPWQRVANVYMAGHRLGYVGTPSFLAFWDLNEVKTRGRGHRHRCGREALRLQGVQGVHRRSRRRTRDAAPEGQERANAPDLHAARLLAAPDHPGRAGRGSRATRPGGGQGMIRLPVREEKKARPAKKRPDTPPMTKGNMQVRVVSFAIIVAAVFLVLAARLWYLQILTGTEYSIAARATQTLEVKDPAQRGVIRDRDGEVLANNVPGLNVTVTPENISREKVGELAKILGADPETVLGSYDAAYDWGTQYSPMLVKENAPRDGVTYVMERTEEFPGVVVNDDYVRNYPAGDTAAHILGYTGAITQEELKLDAYKGLANDSVVGKSGIELYYEEVLARQGRQAGVQGGRPRSDRARRKPGRLPGPVRGRERRTHPG